MTAPTKPHTCDWTMPDGHPCGAPVVQGRVLPQGQLMYCSFHWRVRERPNTR